MLKNIPKIADSHLKTNPNSPQSFTATEAAHITCATFWTKHALENKSVSVPYSRYTILHWKKYITPPLAMFSQNNPKMSQMNNLFRTRHYLPQLSHWFSKRF